MSISFPDLPNTTFPESLSEPVRMEDITIDDLPLISQYNQYIANSDLAGATAFLEANPTLKPKILSANNINEARDLSVAIARLFFNNVETYFINAIKYKGDYIPTVTYTKFNIVRYNGLMYMGIMTDIPVGTLPTDETYFVQQTMDGATFIPSIDSNGNVSWTNNKDLPNPPSVNVKGESGTGMTPRGLWNIDTPYYKDDCVTHNNMLWYAKRDNTGVAPFEGEDWGYFSIFTNIDGGTY